MLFTNENCNPWRTAKPIFAKAISENGKLNAVIDSITCNFIESMNVYKTPDSDNIFKGSSKGHDVLSNFQKKFKSLECFDNFQLFQEHFEILSSGKTSNFSIIM